MNLKFWQSLYNNLLSLKQFASTARKSVPQRGLLPIKSYYEESSRTGTDERQDDAGAAVSPSLIADIENRPKPIAVCRFREDGSAYLELTPFFR